MSDEPQSEREREARVAIWFLVLKVALFLLVPLLTAVAVAFFVL